MGKESTTTYTCDICSKRSTIKGKDIPKNWMELESSIICAKCIGEIIRENKERAKKILDGMKPVESYEHRHGCSCQACNPWAD